MNIEIYSDVICPWCYVGKRRLERALELLRESTKPQIVWRPFQLNPTMPSEGMDRLSYLESKFGSLEAFGQIEEQVIEAGTGEQIQFRFDKIARTPNTFLAHRLIWYAGQKGVQDAVVEALFRGYFEEGADIGSMETLGRLAERAGLPADAILRGQEGTTEVKAEEATGRRLGIRAVPYFVLNGTFGISGAQPAQQFVSAIERVHASAPAAAGGLAGER